MLAIEVVFLTGRYVATAYNTRTESEWPPHPARLFSALVATHFAADPYLTEGHAAGREALEWLERQPPPEICASEASAREVVTVYVPVNDVALTNVDDEARTLKAALEELESVQGGGGARQIAAAERKLAAARRKYESAVAKETAAPGRAVSPTAAAAAARVLPEDRTRQPRTFPSVTPVEPVVHFVWPDAQPGATIRAAIERLLLRAVRFGHSSSFVAMRLTDTPREPSWVPVRSGAMSLRVVEVGQLAALERAFETHQEVEPRVMPARQQPYGRPITMPAAPPRGSLFSQEWLVLRRVGGPHVPMAASAGVAARLRRALMPFADPVPEVLSGHRQDRAPSEHPHLAVVPLPFVGHPNASGMVLGVALVLPLAANPTDRLAVYQAVARWEAQVRAEDEETPALPLHLGAAGELMLERVEWGVVAATLRPDTWCGDGCVWSSVTPVALDQNPGDLRSRDPVKVQEAVAAAGASIRTACERIGLPRPVAVEILPAAPWALAAKARAYPRFPESPERTQRVLTHARLTFDEPIRGPVLLGAGRYLGLGLFRPEDRP